MMGGMVRPAFAVVVGVSSVLCVVTAAGWVRSLWTADRLGASHAESVWPAFGGAAGPRAWVYGRTWAVASDRGRLVVGAEPYQDRTDGRRWTWSASRGPAGTGGPWFAASAATVDVGPVTAWCPRVVVPHGAVVGGLALPPTVWAGVRRRRHRRRPPHG